MATKIALTDDLTTVIMSFGSSKSAQIRGLHAHGYDRSTIAHLLTEYYGKEVRYQHVRNVLVTILTGKKDQ